ncbi:MAG: ribosome small subunit-dependent GTPase A [Clostridia bacterium]|nr:ribosome small subunit-dependent GTPase A [Clostridia bacterium]
MTGVVIKVNSNRYFVNIENQVLTCSAYGKVKDYGIKVGDLVEIENQSIKKVLPRKNDLVRPNVANVDAVVIFVAPLPKPDYLLIDKLIINSIKLGLEIIFVVNKNDLSKSFFTEFCCEYKDVDAKFYSINTIDGFGIDDIKNELKGKLSVLAGQSAVGKTSFINALFNLELKTGELSEKIGRGKHTTTSSKIYQQDGIKVIDSPGFAVIYASVTHKDVQEYYLEYLELAPNCKFRGCKHIEEPNCAVKEAVEKGKLSKERYTRYIEIYKELLRRKENYD